MKTIVLLMLTATMLTPVISKSAESPYREVTVTLKDGKEHSILNADFLVVATLVNEIGVTDPIVPPTGYTLTSTNIPMNEIQKIQWIAKDAKDNQARVKLTLKDGKERECFASAAGYPLNPGFISVKGRAKIEGKEYDITFRHDDMRTLTFLRKAN